MELKDFEVFEKKYPVEKYLEYSYEIIEIHRQWCKNADVKVTPSYFFNGRRLSNIYKIEDFEFLLNLSKDDITFP